MYLGALVELATAITVQATLGEVRANLLRRHPGFTPAEWHAVLGGELEPLVVTAGIGVLFWLWIAWANGRRQRWARTAFALFFALDVYGLISGLAKGSAVYAPVDLALGITLCLVQLAAVGLIFQRELRSLALRVWGT